MLMPSKNEFVRWLLVFFLPALFVGSLITIFQFSSLYSNEPLITKLFAAPLAFHFTIVELVISVFVINLFMGRLLVAKVLGFLLLGVHLTCLYIQFASLYLSNDYLTVDALQVSSQVGLLATPFVVTSAVATVIVPWFILSALWLTKMPQVSSSARSVKSLTAQSLFLGIFGLLVMQSYHLRPMRDLKWQFPAQRTPPTEAFFQTVHAYFYKASAKQQLSKRVELTQRDRDTLSDYGIQISGESEVSKEFPLIKPEIYRVQLPNRGRLNVITIFAESLSARLLGAYGGNYNNLTPNIDRFARDSLVVDGYVNHAFPTIPALTGTFCSVFPHFTHTDWAKAKSRLSLPKLFCLPEMLASEGYDTFFLGYSHPRETFFREQMIEFGFRKPLFYEDLTEKYLIESPEQGAYGNSDRQMFQALKGLLTERDALNEAGGRPFYLAMSTIETHVGMDVTTRGMTYGDGNIRTLNTFHNFDYQFGLFMDWFRLSKFAKNTIVVLTADHAHPPSIDFSDLVGRDYQKIPFDQIPLVISMPASEQHQTRLSLSMTSLDYAPTIAQILGIKNQPNHFLGHGLFDLLEKPYHRLGLVDGFKLLRYKGQIAVSGVNLEECIATSSEDESCRLAKGIHFVDSLMTSGRFWPSKGASTDSDDNLKSFDTRVSEGENRSFLGNH